MRKVLKKRLGDIVNFKRGYDLPSYNRKDGRYPIISSGGISGYHSEYKKDGEGLITGRYGTLGEMYYVNGKYWPHNTALYATDFKGNYPKYVYFLMKCLGNLKTSDKSTVPGVNRNDLHEIVIPYINPEFQKEIADFLFLIDTKIELNNRINRELEAMAKTLYDYWFVQFDFPVYNEDGTLSGAEGYKSSGGKMVYNAELKREIPEGWEVEKIANNCNIIDCLHSKKPDFKFEKEEYYLLQLENLKDDGLIDLSNKYFVSEEDYKNWISRIEVKENDIVITNAGRVGATAQIPKNVLSGIGRNITAIRPISISPTYLFLAFRGIDMKRQIAWNTDQGAFFTSLNVKGIKQLYVLRPQRKIEDKFEKIVFAIRQKRELIQIQNQQLTELRDWLLPMLMNGQVRVREAEEQLYISAEQSRSMAAESGEKYKTKEN